VDHGETSSPSNPSNVIIPKGKKKEENQFRCQIKLSNAKNSYY
jgi:hypothetical protein